MSFRLFREEEDLVASARKVLDGGQFDDAEARTRFEDLLQGYEKLFKDTRRLVRISDRNEAELNRLAQSLEEQADELRTARDAAEAATRAKDAWTPRKTSPLSPVSDSLTESVPGEWNEGSTWIFRS